MSKQYNREMKSSTPACQIQKIYSTTQHICLGVRRPGQTLWWWLGRQKPFEGIMSLEAPPASQFRCSDAITQWLRSKLKGRWLERLEIDEANSCLKLVEADAQTHLYFGYCDGVLQHVEANKLENSKWSCRQSNASGLLEYDTPQEALHFDQVALEKLPNPKERLEEWFKKNEKQFVKKNEKKLNRKIKNIENDLNKLNSYKELYLLAEKHDDLMRERELIHHGIKIKFSTSMNAYQRADLVFQKAKRLKNALELQYERLETTKSYLLNRVKTEAFNIKPTHLPWSLPGVKVDRVQAPAENQQIKFFEYILPNQVEVAVGTSAQANDHLRKTWAKKNDYWVHIEHIAGAHLFYHSEDVPDLNTWEMIGSILRDHSKTESEQVTLVWTQVKNLRSVKGSAGLVRFSKEKRITVNYRPQWRNLLSLR